MTSLIRATTPRRVLWLFGFGSSVLFSRRVRRGPGSLPCLCFVCVAHPSFGGQFVRPFACAVVSDQIYDEIPEDLRDIVEDVVLNRSSEASEKLLARAELEREKAEVCFWCRARIE